MFVRLFNACLCMHATSACLSLTAHIARRACVQWCHRFALESVCARVSVYERTIDNKRYSPVLRCSTVHSSKWHHPFTLAWQQCLFIYLAVVVRRVFLCVRVNQHLGSRRYATLLRYECICVCVCLFETTEPNSPQFFWLPYFSYCKSPNTSRNLDLDNIQFA